MLLSCRVVELLSCRVVVVMISASANDPHPTCVLLILRLPFLDGYCSTVQGLLECVEVDLGFTELLFIQIDLCVMCVFANDPYPTEKERGREGHLS